MKWLGTLKRMCSREQNINMGSNENLAATNNAIQAEKKRKAFQWLAIAILIAMPTVAHIFTIPFFLFGAKKPTCQLESNATLTSGTNETDFNVTTSVMNQGGCPNKTSNSFRMDKSFFNDMHFFSDVMLEIRVTDIGNGNDSSVQTTPPPKPKPVVANSKYLFFAGLFIGSISIGPLTAYFGRQLTFKILARTMIISDFLMSMCRTVYTLSTCWFLVGSCLMSLFCLIFVELLEKFDSVIETEPQVEVENETRAAKFAKFKLRLTVGVGFTFTWILGRLLTVMIAYFTRDWTLIIMWIGITFSIIYYLFGDFFTENMSNEKKTEEKTEEKSEEKTEYNTEDDGNLLKALFYNPIFLLNLFILALNWFVACHNLYGLVIGWVNLSLTGTMFENTLISESFVLISIPLAYCVSIASKRKLLPFGLLQLFTGIFILLMIAFPRENLKLSPNAPTLATGSILIAHVANVLVSAALSILWVITIEAFPKKYRIHCLGFCCACARIGTMVGVTLNDMKLFTEITGPAFAGGLSVISAILSRLLPDVTTVKMLATQAEIEREQFPSLSRPPRPNDLPLEGVAVVSKEGVAVVDNGESRCP